MDQFNVEFKEGYPTETQEKSITITENKTTEIVKDANYAGMRKVVVITNIQPPLQQKSLNIIDNGNYEFIPDVDKYGLSKVVASVNIPLQEKVININQDKTEIVLPDVGIKALSKITINVKEVPDNATFKITKYNDSGKIQKVTFKGGGYLGYFIMCSAFTSIDEITFLGDELYNFSGNFIQGSQIEELHFPKNIKSIVVNAFLNMTKLKKVYFNSNVSESFHSSSFNNCPNVTDIYCKWAEGAVANAPWGLPSTATIHYNYSE